MSVIQPILGFVAIVAFAWLLSSNRRAFSWRGVAIGIAIQLLLAFLLLKLPGVQIVFVWVNEGVLAVQKATEAGTSLVFGFLGGGNLPYEETVPGASFVFAFRALPMVMLISALSALLYYWRILPWIVQGFAWGLTKAFRISGPASFATAGNIFVGNIEAPLFVRPYLDRLSHADLFVIMTAGLATIAGTVFALYSFFLQDVIPNAAGHLLTASLISAPAAVVIARIMVPPEEKEEFTGELIKIERRYKNAMDAITQGTIDGLKLLAYIIALVLVLVAMVALVNIIFGIFPDLWGEPLTLERILGWTMAPVAWLMGIPWEEAFLSGQLLGEKIVLNELITYLAMSQMGPEELSESTRVILAYAMCGFANFGGLGVIIGGLGAIIPDRRNEILQLGVKALIAGNLATFMTGCVASLLV